MAFWRRMSGALCNACDAVLSRTFAMTNFINSTGFWKSCTSDWFCNIFYAFVRLETHHNSAKILLGKPLQYGMIRDLDRFGQHQDGALGNSIMKNSAHPVPFANFRNFGNDFVRWSQICNIWMYNIGQMYNIWIITPGAIYLRWLSQYYW